MKKVILGLMVALSASAAFASDPYAPPLQDITHWSDKNGVEQTTCWYFYDQIDALHYRQAGTYPPLPDNQCSIYWIDEFGKMPDNNLRTIYG